MERPQGVMTALITPLHKDDALDYSDLQKMIEFQFANNIHGIVPCGTTGQSPTLSGHEHHEITKLAVRTRDILDYRGPIIVGAGSNDTDTAIEATKAAIDVGANATLHVTGYYNMPTQQGFADYFASVAKASQKKGVIIYNIPGRGHPIIQADVMAALAKENPNIWGTKDATGGKAKPEDKEGSFWKAVRRETRKRGLGDKEFLILSGDDPVTYAMMTDPEIAANGVISVWSNVFPHAYAEMAERIWKGDYTGAAAINEDFRELNGLVGVRVPYYFWIGNERIETHDTWRNPQPVQYAAWLLGMTEELGLRSPMMKPPQELATEVGGALYRLHQKRPDYFKPMQKHFRPSPSVTDRLMLFKP